MYRRGVLRTTVAVAAVATGMAAGPAAAADDPTIGALLPMTGDLQAYGKTSSNGVKLAARQINDQGGVLGGKLQVEVGDTQTKSQAGVDAAKKLVSIQGVSGIVGALSSGVTIPVARSVTSQAEVPQISSASTSPTITDLDDNDFLFRTVPSDALQGDALARVAAEQGLENVAIFYVNNAYGEGLAGSFTEGFEARGNTVSASQPYEKGNASYRGGLKEAASGGAEALVLIGYPQNGITIMRQALEGGYFRKFVFTDGMKAPEIIDSIGAQYLNGSFGTAPQSSGKSTAAERFDKAYKDAYGKMPPKPFIDTAYDAAFLLGLAMEKADSQKGPAVRDALRPVANPPGEEILPGEWKKARRLLNEGKPVNYTGASGPVNFDKNGDVGGSFAHWKIEDGEIVTEKVFKPDM